MKNITIKIQISPIQENNLIEASQANKVGNNIIHKITGVLNDVKTSDVNFDFKITTE